jgi:hypothetical protein
MSPLTAYQAQITEIHNLRASALHGCSEQSLTETGSKRKNPTNTFYGAEMLKIYINKFGDLKSITFK